MGKQYYTYLWLREDGTPYYVGKGSGNRAYTPYGHRVKPPTDNIRILIQFWESEEKAFEIEKWWIAFYGRKDLGTGCLRNLTDGGEDPPRAKKGRISTFLGKKHTKEAKEKIRKAHIGMKPTRETLEKLRFVHTGIEQSKRTRLKRSLSLKGRPSPMKGRKHSLETVERIRKANTGRKRSQESIIKMRIAATEREKRKRHDKLLQG
jgi:hypothetical protein